MVDVRLCHFGSIERCAKTFVCAPRRSLHAGVLGFRVRNDPVVARCCAHWWDREENESADCAGVAVADFDARSRGPWKLLSTVAEHQNVSATELRDEVGLSEEQLAADPLERVNEES
jgi:hypothetical protein